MTHIILLIIVIIISGCSEDSHRTTPEAEPQVTKVTIYGDSLCSSTEGDPSWARRLNDVEGYDVNDLCINGYRATYPVFSEDIVNDESDIFIMTLGVNDATGMAIDEVFAKQHGLTKQTIDDYRSAYYFIIGTALMNGSKVICVLPPFTGVAWVQPFMPQIWTVIIDACDGVAEIVRAAPSDGGDYIHYDKYSDDFMYEIMLETIKTTL